MIRKLRRAGLSPLGGKAINLPSQAIYFSDWAIWRYRVRGRWGRMKRTALSRTIVDNPEITYHVKRNRTFQLINKTK